MRQNSKIAIGIIGKNFGYNVIYRSLLKDDSFKITSFCVRKNKNKPKLKKNIKIYSNWKKIINDKNNDAVIISTPPTLQKKIILSAVKNNKHIFCEKPCTTSTEDLNQILDSINDNKNFLSHMVNYSIAYLPAFQFFKKKILNNKNVIKTAELQWIIYSNNKNRNWKNNHKKGGGILYNFYCHSIYYIELMFGRIKSINVNIKNTLKNNDNYLIGDLVLQNNLKIKLKLLVGNLKKHRKSIHQLSVKTIKNKRYILTSGTKNLTDTFRIYEIKKSKNFKTKKLIYNSKFLNNDFRIKPTSLNLRRFARSILKKKIDRASFFEANYIHHIIDKSLISSKMQKRIVINQ